MSETPETAEPQGLMPWRTVFFLGGLAALALAGARLLLAFGDAGAKAFDTLALLYLGLGGVQGLKTTFEHAASGTGFKGAWRAITTDAKPGQPAAPDAVKVVPGA